MLEEQLIDIVMAACPDGNREEVAHSIKWRLKKLIRQAIDHQRWMIKHGNEIPF